MPSYIIKLIDKKTNENYYLFWSTVVDAPVSHGMSLEEFKKDYIKSDLTNYEERIERVNKKGTSSLIDESVDALISFNRAGPEESCLSYDELVRFYCLKEKVDEDHPCWQQRRKEFNHRSEVNGGLTYADEKEIITMFPYKEAPE